ncbi:MAG: hypothetical protein C0608_07515 [Deltaproteobacteria bacterium]|nr:MAG: hypothetical protein C0608_07515 [Deltaproteobacteria bacterium]
MQINSACKAFITHCQVDKNLSRHTLRAYRADLDDFISFMGSTAKITECDKERFREYLLYLSNQRGLKETSSKRRFACLKAVFSWLEEEELLNENPFHKYKVRIKLPARLPRALTLTEAKKLLGYAKRAADSGGEKLTQELSTQVAIEIMLATGIRVGELVSIRLENIDIESGALTIMGKGHRERKVYIVNDGAISTLESYLKKRNRITSFEQTLLLNSQGNPVTTDQIRKWVRDAAESAGIKRRITPHMLRNPAATFLLEAGLDIRYVQKLLGHRSISTTQIYTHVTDTGLKDALITAALNREKMIDN